MSFNQHLVPQQPPIQEEIQIEPTLISKEKFSQIVGNKKDLYYFFDIEGSFYIFYHFFLPKFLKDNIIYLLMKKQHLSF